MNLRPLKNETPSLKEESSLPNKNNNNNNNNNNTNNSRK